MSIIESPSMLVGAGDELGDGVAHVTRAAHGRSIQSYASNLQYCRLGFRAMCVQYVHSDDLDRRGDGGSSWLGTRSFSWLTPQRLHRITVGLVAMALLASATLISGSG
jgi:hypothetical protein